MAPELTLVRESRLAAGTVVGVVAPAGTHDAVYAAIERAEAELSEWRENSRVGRLNTSVQSTGQGQMEVTKEDRRLFRIARAVERRSDGAFSLTWQGGTWSLQGATVSADGPLGLGGILKGWLVDRAAETLERQGVRRFLVDAAGDVRVRGAWTVDVAVAGQTQSVLLRDAALSTSGEEQQPGHIHDGRARAAVTCSLGATVTAPTATWADALATAAHASCGELRPPLFTHGTWYGADGSTRRW